ncbi:50S ribosomal protein L3 [Candidatus Parcubacteria bacterium]|nr:MAG: 50S ribosomal protein L3 [Candidatus Parcubacteria bacterium]
MKFLLGRKLNMTQIFDEKGNVVPATVVSAGPVSAAQIKSKEKDGYDAIVFGFGEKKEKRVKKPQKNLGNFAVLRERRIEGDEKAVELGHKLDVSLFNAGDIVEISGITKGKGFQGVVKRHDFRGGQRTHGQKHSEREPGSIGGGLRTRVPSGMRMAGRMGGDRVTVKNLKVLKVDKEKNELLISGAVPGSRGTLLEIKQVKK